MKKCNILLVIALLSVTQLFGAIKNEVLISPNGKLKVDVSLGGEITYTVKCNGDYVVVNSPISMTIRDKGVIGENPKLLSAKHTTVKESIEAPFHRNKQFSTSYNQLEMRFKGDYGLIFRAYDEGVAYRFVTTMKDSIIVENEVASFCFDNDYKAYVPFPKSKEVKKVYCMSFQAQYKYINISDFSKSLVAFMPLTVDLPKGVKLTITESDMVSYPGMFLAKGDGNALISDYPGLPSLTKDDETRSEEEVVERHDYIAKVNGMRTYPWRVLAITTTDAEMLTNNMVYALASPNKIGDYSWVKPGKVAWDWWNDWGIYGVDFKVGINTQTYKHYVDFASKNGIEYVVLDEGWYVPESGDMLTVIDDIDLPELIRYGREKNVGIILWTVGKVLDRQLEEANKKYSEMGAVGFKVDFFNRDDQYSVERIERIAAVGAKYKMMIDYHGVAKPTGLNRAYPNAINFEGVFGLEELKWSNPNMPLYDVTMPFIRQMAGPVDYTQGAMTNATKEDFKDIYYSPMSQGTRAHQMATYVIFDSPLVMMCDSPTAYAKNQECTDMIASVPVVFDEVKVLHAKVGEYVVMARRSKDNWYIGGLTSWIPRDIELDFSFLGNGKYKAVIFRDGLNTDRSAEDYIREEIDVDKTTKHTIPLASGGGFLIKIEGK
ncbi:MAG: glycoside hydrolase family 97 protein [Rikenellaceae bacterium]